MTAASRDADPAVVGLLHRVGDHLHLFVHFVEAAPHEALDGKDGVLRVGHALALGHLAHQTLTVLSETHH